MPSIKGISGPTITKPISKLIITVFISSKSEMFILRFLAIEKIPAFPGATKISSIKLDCKSFQQNACSLAPEPIIKVFILQI